MVARSTPPTRRGLTLIELLVAMAIGLVVAFTAYAGFNAAVETVTKVGSMSQQNRMLRVGFQHALEDVDHWHYYDRADHLALREKGHPFHPMEDGQFSSDHLAWQRSSFYAGSTQVLFDELGNYARVGFAEQDGLSNAPIGGEPMPVWSKGNDYHNRTEWLYQQVGFYAMIEYLPANAIYHYYNGGASGGRYHSPGGRNWTGDNNGKRAFTNPGADTLNRPDQMVTSGLSKIDKNPNYARLWWPWNGLAAEPKPVMRQRWLTSGNSFFITPNASYGRDPDGDGVLEATTHNHWWISNVGWRGVNSSHPWNLNQFHRHCAPVTDLMPGKPPEWPGLTYYVKRRAAIHPIVSGHVTVEDPIEGTTQRLNFASLGTTLRGARMQRGLDTYVSHYGTGDDYVVTP